MLPDLEKLRAEHQAVRFSDDSDWAPADVLACPLCAYNYQHVESSRKIDSNDDYTAGWGGRGDLLVVKIRGECESEWECCFGFHKGDTVFFARIIKACGPKEYPR